MPKNENQSGDDQAKREQEAANERRRIQEALDNAIKAGRALNRDGLKARTKDDVEPPDDDQ